MESKLIATPISLFLVACLLMGSVGAGTVAYLAEPIGGSIGIDSALNWTMVSVDSNTVNGDVHLDGDIVVGNMYGGEYATIRGSLTNMGNSLRSTNIVITINNEHITTGDFTVEVRVVKSTGEEWEHSIDGVMQGDALVFNTATIEPIEMVALWDGDVYVTITAHPNIMPEQTYSFEIQPRET